MSGRAGSSCTRQLLQLAPNLVMWPSDWHSRVRKAETETQGWRIRAWAKAMTLLRALISITIKHVHWNRNILLWEQAYNLSISLEPRLPLQIYSRSLGEIKLQDKIQNGKPGFKVIWSYICSQEANYSITCLFIWILLHGMHHDNSIALRKISI